MRRMFSLVVLLTLIAGCGIAEVEAESEVAEEMIVEGEDVTPTTVPVLAEEEGSGPLEIATLLPIESGTFEDDHWIKWKLDTPIPDPVENHVTYQLNIRSSQEDIFGVAWTTPLNDAPFASGFCLEDRPNCDDGIVAVGVELGSDGDELIFRIPKGTFGDATGLEVGAFVQTFSTADADPDTEYVADGTQMPLGTDERDPC